MQLSRCRQPFDTPSWGTGYRSEPRAYFEGLGFTLSLKASATTGAFYCLTMLNPSLKRHPLLVAINIAAGQVRAR
jgi:hypothetical protein